jgi:phenylalanyl-tRNA synthetase beta chain
VGAGYAEAMTLPLLSPADLERAGFASDGVIQVENPLRAEESVLRPSVLPGLLKAVQYNASHGNADVALFELGTVFFPPTNGRAARPEYEGVFRGDSALLPDEHEHLGAVRAGAIGRRPYEPDRTVEPSDAVVIVDALRDGLRLADVRLHAVDAPGWRAGRAAEVLVDGTPVGVVGELAREALRAHNIDAPVVGCEIDVDLLLAGKRRDDAYQPVSRFPASNIDLAFVVDDAVPAAAIVATLRAAAGDVLESVRCFDEFRSEALGAARRSLAFALRFRTDHTLTDEEVARLRQAGIDAVTRAHGAELRA